MVTSSDDDEHISSRSMGKKRACHHDKELDEMNKKIDQLEKSLISYAEELSEEKWKVKELSKKLVEAEAWIKGARTMRLQYMFDNLTDEHWTILKNKEQVEKKKAGKETTKDMVARWNKNANAGSSKGI